MPDGLEDLAGLRVLVTGGSLGIGLEVSRELARRGAHVLVAARGVEALQEAVSGLPGDGHRGLRLDVSDEAAWEGAMETIDSEGELHGLVTAAGVLGPIGSLERVAPRRFNEAVAINLGGTMLALHHAVSRLQMTSGRAVTLSGGGATSPLPRYDAYAVSKAAVVRLTENVAATGAIEVNCVAPGFVATRVHQDTLSAGPDAAGADYYERTRQQLAAGGFPVTEAAQLICFLLSSAASGITGRLVSAQWDPWRDIGFRERLRTDETFGTLRRIDGQFFAPVERA